MNETPGAESVAVRWGRIAALVVMVMTALNWVGWATGREILVRTLPGWPLMPPWASLWLFALASAVLLMSGRSGLVWAGRVVAAAVTVTTAIILAEYVAAQNFGIDRVWFRQSVDHLYRSLPGRPSELAAAAALLLSVAIGVSSTARSWARWCWGVCLTAAMAIAGLTGIAYLFGAVALANETPSTGLALGAAAGTLLTGAAAALTRPARVPVAWLSTNQRTTLRLLMLLLGAVLLVGALRRVFMALGASGAEALSFAVSLGLVLCGAAVIQLGRGEQKLVDAVRYERNLLRASSDAMLDPQLLVEAVRGPDGQVVDLVYRSVNRATCNYLGRSEHDLVGTRVSEVAPETVTRGLMALTARCLEDGQPVIFNDLRMPTSYFPEGRYYDMRATKAGDDLISIAVSDVTDQHEDRARLAASEQEYRLLATNIGDVIARVRDDTFVWMSPSAEEVLGAPPAYWVGRKLTEFIPPEDIADQAARLKAIAAGGMVKGRIRVVLFDGTTHWAHLNAKPFFDTAGEADGSVATLRLIDDEVAAQQAAESALRRAALADSRYRRSVQHAATGMALLSRDGRFQDVNDALCKLIGYPRDVLLLQKTFQDLTAPEHRDRSIAAFEDLAAGRQDSVRMTKQCIRADGQLIWVDVTVSSVPDDNGVADQFLAQIIDVTDQIEASTRNRQLAHRLQQLTERLTVELGSAAAYLSSIMPSGLTGKVTVSSCYLPSRELGGDCFDYTWIDDDHLLVYLIDVSGHGLQPALLAVSIHNMLRSRSLSTETLLSPEQTLDTLNQLFRMDRQSDLYFTAWYGIYQHSTRTLRYTSAGAPPALALTTGTGRPVKPTELSTPCPPIGILEETPFVENTFCVPEGGQLLIYSDGAFELDSDAPPMPLHDFTSLVSRLAAAPNWTLEQMVHKLQDLTPTGTFEDDCSLILLTFP